MAYSAIMKTLSSVLGFPIILTLPFLILPLSGCLSKPEGPAERIGRSLDDLSQGVQDLSKEYENEDTRDSSKVRNNRKPSSPDDILPSPNSEDRYQREWEEQYRRDQLRSRDDLGEVDLNLRDEFRSDRD
jgi:hypothetical protein